MLNAEQKADFYAWLLDEAEYSEITTEIYMSYVNGLLRVGAVSGKSLSQNSLEVFKQSTHGGRRAAWAAFTRWSNGCVGDTEKHKTQRRRAFRNQTTRRYEVEYSGTTYSSQRSRAKAYGLSAALVSRRVGRGWSLQKALETPKQPIGRPRKSLD